MIKLALVQKKDYGNGQVGEDQAVGAGTGPQEAMTGGYVPWSLLLPLYGEDVRCAQRSPSIRRLGLGFLLRG